MTRAPKTSARRSLLAGMTPDKFLRDHWQKRPLLVRQALPGFRGIIDRDDFLALATREDATSRLILQHPKRTRGRWERHDGPFGGLDASMLPRSHWTLLVHGLESLVPGGWELLRHFDFIPSARVDDLMVSFATDGGGVGPHDDRYDVFLLQGAGKRRWQVSTQEDRAVDPDASIRVLADFRGEEEWLLEPGDMLYLPPGVAHFGVAEGDCFTYSIGFLAPSHRTLIEEFLGYLGATLGAGVAEDRLYEDPGLRPAQDPLQLDDAMVDQVADVLRTIRWERAHVEEFLGRFLTRPKPHARFAAPARPMTEATFARKLRGPGGARAGRILLALPTRGLVRGKRLFLNGEAHTVSRATLATFATLVSERALPLPLRGVDDATLALLHAAYVAGYLRIS